MEILLKDPQAPAAWHISAGHENELFAMQNAFPIVDPIARETEVIALKGPKGQGKGDPAIDINHCTMRHYS